MLYQDHESVIRAIYTGSQFLESVGSGSEVGIVLESTSFYAEQGGQVLYTLGFFLPSFVKIPGSSNMLLVLTCLNLNGSTLVGYHACIDVRVAWTPSIKSCFLY